MKLSKILGITLFVLTLAAISTVLQNYGNIAFPPMILNTIRWAGITLLVYYAFRKRHLTTWILVSMILGAEIGYSFPDFAQNLNVLSRIFLRLIKTIIAPLIFATLVVGIAGHSNLKQVGKMGIKSLIYFEVVTTIALFIGLAAINFSRAGEGIVLNAAATSEIKAPEKQTVSDIILHIFPENIAKSVAEGEVLQIVIFSILFGIGLAMLSNTAVNHYWKLPRVWPK